MVITRIREEVLSSLRLSEGRGRFGGVVVIGGANIDLRGRPVGEVLERYTFNPGRINVGSGGVGRNNDEVEAANIIRAMQDLGLGGGMIIANPIPKEYALSMEYMNEMIEEAVMAAEKEGIKGKKLTPYLLGRIKELTGGESLRANIELVKDNARVGAKIAHELVK